MALDEPAQLLEVLGVGPLGLHKGGVESRRELRVRVSDEGQTPGHARADVVADVTEHDDHAPGHVLARVVAHSLDHGGRARVAYAEALACGPGDEHLPTGCPVEARV